MIIKNRDALATSELRKQALDIIETGIARVLPPNIIKSAVRYDRVSRTLAVDGDNYSLSRGRVFVIGGGKASGLMAETLEKIIPPDNIAAGVVNCKSEFYKTSKTKIIAAGHPIPDRRGIGGVNEMLALKKLYSINTLSSIHLLQKGQSNFLDLL